MPNIIEELFYGNLEPQELTTEITPSQRLPALSNFMQIKKEQITHKMSDLFLDLYLNSSTFSIASAITL